MNDYEIREKVLGLLAELMGEETPTMFHMFDAADKIIDVVRSEVPSSKE